MSDDFNRSDNSNYDDMEEGGENEESLESISSLKMLLMARDLTTHNSEGETTNGEEINTRERTTNHIFIFH